MTVQALVATVFLIRMRTQSDAFIDADVHKMRCLERVARCHVDNAHASALRGVWTDGTLVFSCGLDQTVAAWRIDCHELPEQLEDGRGPSEQLSGCHLRELQRTALDVLEPALLDAVAGSGRKHTVCVVGRGLQVLEWCQS